MSPLSDSKIHALLVNAKLPTKIVKHFACNEHFTKLTIANTNGGYLRPDGEYTYMDGHPAWGLGVGQYLEINWQPNRGTYNPRDIDPLAPLFLVVYAVQGSTNLPNVKGNVWGGEQYRNLLRKKPDSVGTTIEVTSGGHAYFAVVYDCQRYYDSAIWLTTKSGAIYLHRIDIYQLAR